MSKTTQENLEKLKEAQALFDAARAIIKSGPSSPELDAELQRRQEILDHLYKGVKIDDD